MSLALVALYFIRVAIYLSWLYLATEATNKASSKFTHIQHKPERKALFIGDSLTHGTGASSPSKSIAGLYSQDSPECSVYNESVNNITTKNLLEVIEEKMSRVGEVDTVILSVGSNDAIKFRSMKNIHKRLEEILDKLEPYSRDIYVFTPTKPGRSPALIKYLVYARLNKFRHIVESAANSRSRVYHIDMWGSGDAILAEPSKYFVSDSIHLSDAGQEFWYEELKKNLQVQIL